jgi:hypothetical protein
MDDGNRSRRMRWVTLGAVVAVLAGGGGVWTISAGPASSGSTFVPITSCRLLDTRPAPDNVGSRSTPLRADDTLEVSVRGTSGNCTIPSDATAVSMNVTIVGPTSTSYLTVFPSDASPRPLVSSLNWVAGQAPTANAVTSRLSADGKLSFYNLSGSVDLLADVVGYYTPSPLAGAGPSGPAGPTGPTGPVGATGPKGDPGADAPLPANVLYVASSGGDYTTLSAALDAIGTDLPAASSTNPYLVEIGPGTFTETGTVHLKSYVGVRGAGSGVTTITCACDITNPDGSITVLAGLVSGVELRDLTIRNTGTGAGPIHGLWVAVPAATLRLRHVTVEAAGSDTTVAMRVELASTVLADDLTVRSTGATSATGLEVDAGTVHLAGSTVTALDHALTNTSGSIVVVDSTITSDDDAINNAVTATTKVRQSMIVGDTPDGLSDCVGVWDGSYADRTCA